MSCEGSGKGMERGCQPHGDADRMRQGNVNYRIYNIRLNGGTLRNGGYGQSMNGTKSDGSLGHLTLTADSTIETAFNTVVYTIQRHHSHFSPPTLADGQTHY